MMRKYSLLLILFSVFTFSQKYTKQEIARITEGNIDTALPIFQTSDSLQNKVLLGHSIDAHPKNRYTKILVNRMKSALISTDGGVGIAAPQVGINRNIIWAKRFDKEGTPLEYFINPKIIWRSEVLNLGPEGDLSIEVFRDYFYRSQVIQLEYFDLNGKKHTEIVEGFTAVILQHEIDHLSGILISDKIENQKMKTFEKVELYKEIQ
ncbi:peptide deformylase [Chryseobacterium gotjawalense]|uniref:Peptide deformylase-like n=1 Tax=Chryseobacterium gotjawalense TaxID=3042315 RepID=A0ABY8RGB5_9FLAO|nr:peptide deformylase [Chryseobacterium sp. wdc7]WHF52044.1 peptide deformylase [Chryseobacterium sp. wdc7]